VNATLCLGGMYWKQICLEIFLQLLAVARKVLVSRFSVYGFNYLQGLRYKLIVKQLVGYTFVLVWGVCLQVTPTNSSQVYVCYKHFFWCVYRLEEEEQKQRQNKSTSPPPGDGQPSADQQFLKLMNVVCIHVQKLCVYIDPECWLINLTIQFLLLFLLRLFIYTYVSK